MKAIIFGVGGQDGFYLRDLLLKKGIKVVGIEKNPGNWEVGDVGNFTFVDNLIKKEKPDYVFHFAAISSMSHDLTLINHKAICDGALNILEAVKKHVPKCKVFLSGSALQFKNTGGPINEKSVFEARSGYSASRIASVYMGRYYRDISNIPVYVGYFFNHDSPLRTQDHINKLIVDAAKEVANGSKKKIKIGDLSAKKEFNFAGDIMEAVWILVNQTKVYEAVIGSGKAYSVGDWVSYCFKKVGKDWHKYILPKKDYVSDYKILISNPKLIKSLGWKPKVDFYKLADMMMEA